MIGHNLWSYAPYKPLLRNVGDIYICRIAPSENTIHFEWLDIGAEEYSVFYRPRNVGDFICYGKTKNTEFDIVNLETDTDYEFYIESGEKKSLIRLARTGKTVGTVVNYLHPDDEAYSFSGRYLCSPSLVRHPDGFLLASMDLFAGSHRDHILDGDPLEAHRLLERKAYSLSCSFGNRYVRNILPVKQYLSRRRLIDSHDDLCKR